MVDDTQNDLLFIFVDILPKIRYTKGKLGDKEMTKRVGKKQEVKASASLVHTSKKVAKQDDTEYLMSNPANKKFIEESLEEIKVGKVRKVELFRL